MKLSTLSAKERIHAATLEIEAALTALKTSQEIGPTWLACHSIDKTKEAITVLENALWSVDELLASEEGNEPYPDLFDQYKIKPSK